LLPWPGHFRQTIEWNLLSEGALPEPVNAPMRRCSTQPWNGMPIGFNGSPVLIQLEKDVLRNFLGEGCIVKEIPGDAVNHCLVVAYEDVKIRLPYGQSSGPLPLFPALLRIGKGS
jgi:hypothetical protein